MVKVQVDLDEKENKLLNMYRLIYDIDNKPDAIKHLISAQSDKIDKIKKKNAKEVAKAEKEADKYDCDPTEEEEELAEAEEELMGY